MAAELALSRIPISITSTGTTEGAQVLKASGMRAGRVRELKLRQTAGGGMTDCLVAVVTNGSTGTAYASVADEDVAVDVTPTSVTASATVAFVDTPIEGFAAVKDSLEIRIHTVTGTGAWTVVGHIVVEH